MLTISGTAITTFSKNVIVNNLELLRHTIMDTYYFGITNFMRTKNVHIE